MTREITPAELWQLYMKGWKHGARARVTAKDPALADHANGEIRRAYDDGYQAGRMAHARAAEAASRTYGHKPGILRTQS